jgi:SAM-dependent methyltransferase
MALDPADPTEYWEARLGKGLDLSRVGYLGLGKQYNRWLYAVRRRVFLRELRAAPIELRRSDVLDVGSGSGFYIDRWKELGVRSIVGSDLTRTATEGLRARYPGDECHRLDIGGDIGPLAGRQFDAVSAMDVLFHIVDDGRFARALRNIRLLLRPRALFVFSDNFVRRGTVRAAHQVSRSLAEIEARLSETGFEVLRRVPMAVLMNFPIDTDVPYWPASWRALARVVATHEALGFAIGAALLPVELICVSTRQEGPTTEMMVCRPVPTGPAT